MLLVKEVTARCKHWASGAVPWALTYAVKAYQVCSSWMQGLAGVEVLVALSVKARWQVLAVLPARWRVRLALAKAVSWK